MKEITTIEVQNLIEKGEQLHVVDVREADEVAAGTIPGAIHIPLGDIPARISELDVSKSYILICRSGARSGRATAFLTEKGYDVANMVGGILEWEGETE
ncbi:rhodanese-like domain-containing protein [Sporosarcina limicola]|uniref:Rhodanese-related sulfurtransferase n=1 Tax=Sporosarcina limicola TaxID=34101 RepID=A0A927MG13_9BACL|nr:rhodanese-like domain-containing protein [Sporosarcina limicola]MBE1553086.1 rhodanese-related sulfurtransferase [Sporosarcina limicola]